MKRITTILLKRNDRQTTRRIGRRILEVVGAESNNSRHRLLRFCLVGACGTVVNIAIIVTLVRIWNVPAVPADVVAIELSIISNFFINNTYTFGNNLRQDSAIILARRLLRFNAAAIGGAAISFVTFFICHQLLGLQYVVADLLGITLAIYWNYTMSRRLVWQVADD